MLDRNLERKTGDTSVLAREKHPDNKELWEYYLRAATDAFNERRYSKASQILKQALHEISQFGEIENSLLARADALADVYTRLGDFRQAASLYRTIVEARRKILGSDHPDVHDASRRLASLLWQSGGLSPRTALP